MSAKLTNADAPEWGLYAKTPNRKNMDARKSIKVKLPIRQHIKLHALKLFTEKNISETVEKALDHYFREMKDTDAEAVGKMEANLQAQGGIAELTFEVGVGDEE
ncbi:MAG TPA: hypothetical protein VM370_04895 [Candidatus Thermoplasmatota archaeon]|nr:hypothetical protein [Candidatus Thermoplasmatota archaeon]